MAFASGLAAEHALITVTCEAGAHMVLPDDLYGGTYRLVDKVLSRWGLADKAGTSFAKLSGGQKQRLFIALALVGNPEVVFLDELTAGLDPGARRATWDLISEVRAQGVTVVLVSHFMDEVEELCDRVAILEQGQIAALDTPAGLVSRNAWVAWKAVTPAAR